MPPREGQRPLSTHCGHKARAAQRIMRPRHPLFLIVLVASCAPDRTPLEREAHEWLGKWPGLSPAVVKVRNVHIVGKAICGEAATLDQERGRWSAFRPFYRLGADGALAGIPGADTPRLLPDMVQCPVIERIDSVCAPTAAERAAAQARHQECSKGVGCSWIVWTGSAGSLPALRRTYRLNSRFPPISDLRAERLKTTPLRT